MSFPPNLGGVREVYASRLRAVKPRSRTWRSFRVQRHPSAGLLRSGCSGCKDALFRKPVICPIRGECSKRVATTTPAGSRSGSASPRGTGRSRPASEGGLSVFAGSICHMESALEGQLVRSMPWRVTERSAVSGGLSVCRPPWGLGSRRPDARILGARGRRRPHHDQTTTSRSGRHSHRFSRCRSPAARVVGRTDAGHDRWLHHSTLTGDRGGRGSDLTVPGRCCQTQVRVVPTARRLAATRERAVGRRPPTEARWWVNFNLLAIRPSPRCLSARHAR